MRDSKKNKTPSTEEISKAIDLKIHEYQVEKAESKPKHKGIKWTEEKLNKIAKQLLNWMDDEDNFSVNKFLFKKRIQAKHLYRYRKRSQKFANALELAYQMEAERIAEMSFLRKGSEGMGRFMLSHKHGWTENKGDQGAKPAGQVTYNFFKELTADYMKETGKKLDLTKGLLEAPSEEEGDVG